MNDDAPFCLQCKYIFPKKPEPPKKNYWTIVTIFLAVLLLVCAFIIPILCDNLQIIKMADARGDQNILSIALETYFLDHRGYPAWSLNPTINAFGDLAHRHDSLKSIPTFQMRHVSQLATLTTPIGYLDHYPSDPFAPIKEATFAYWTDNATRDTTATGFIIWSPGPDRVYDLTIDNIGQAYDPRQAVPSALLLSLTYDASNGTSSRGDVYRYKQ